MKDIIFIRHGATAGNLEKRYVGRTDEPLCEEGRARARALSERLETAPDIIFVSPCLRARETAEILFPNTYHTVVSDLREADFGDFEYKTASELERDPAYRAWVDGGCLGDIPGGESVRGFKARCAAAFKEALETVPAGKTAAFVTHGGVIMAVLEALSTDRRGFYEYYLPNAAALLCRFENGKLIIRNKI
ncbi:MAG: histidine phosphatase family protein [Clostridia bacterium]|nr:histidine phosphatase family protein [Clostridia bacterium]